MAAKAFKEEGEAFVLLIVVVAAELADDDAADFTQLEDVQEDDTSCPMHASPALTSCFAK